MQTQVERAKSFLRRNETQIGLRVVTLALAAASLGHAQALSFTAPSTAAAAQNCSGGGAASAFGATSNANHTVSLTGAVTCIDHQNSSPGVTFDWLGTGAGSFGSSTIIPVTYNIAFAPDPNVTVTGWTLTYLINGSQAGQFSCSNAGGCASTGNVLQTITIPTGASLANYEVQLAVNGVWSNGLGNLTVTVNSISLSSPLAVPAITKSFGPSTITVGSTSTQTVTLTNPNASALSNVSFSDTMPSGIQYVSQTGGTCGSPVTGNAPTSFSFVMPSLAANSSCTVITQVRGQAAGAANNVTSAVTAYESGPGGTASATLTVNATPVPAVSTWGLIALALLLAGTGGLLAMKGREAA